MKLIYLENIPVIYFVDGNDKSVDNIQIINMHHLLKHISHQTDYLTKISNRTLFEYLQYVSVSKVWYWSIQELACSRDQRGKWSVDYRSSGSKQDFTDGLLKQLPAESEWIRGSLIKAKTFFLIWFISFCLLLGAQVTMLSVKSKTYQSHYKKVN